MPPLQQYPRQPGHWCKVLTWFDELIKFNDGLMYVALIVVAVVIRDLDFDAEFLGELSDTYNRLAKESEKNTT
jgi:hypothetical protein